VAGREVLTIDACAGPRLGGSSAVAAALGPPVPAPGEPAMSTVDPRRCALVMIDMARDFVEEGGMIASAGGPAYRDAARGIVPTLQKLIAAARTAGVTVVHAADCHEPGDPELRKWPPHSIKGTTWAEILPEIAPVPGDRVLPKTTYRAFQSTGVDAERKARGIDTIYMTGLHTDDGCRHTSGDAFQKGYDLVWVTDALEAFTPEQHAAGLDYDKAWYATDPDRQFKTADEVVADWHSAVAKVA
jgi:nicotinamidase-related amidase